MGTSSLNMAPHTQGFSSYCKWNDLDPRLIFQLHGEKEDLLSHTTKVTMLQILHMWMLWTTEKEGSSLLAERTLETKRNSCLYWKLFAFLLEFLGFNGEDINLMTPLMLEVTSSLTWQSKNWTKEQWCALTFWWHIVTHCCLTLHTITKGKEKM